jgi:Transposase DDE domain
LKRKCTRSARRLLTLHPREEHETLEAARVREAQPTFAPEDQQRAGIEGTISAGVRVLHLRCARYIGLVKTHRQHVLTAAAMNLVRIGAWLSGTSLAQTRQSAFTKLMMGPFQRDEFASSIFFEASPKPRCACNPEQSGSNCQGIVPYDQAEGLGSIRIISKGRA